MTLKLDWHKARDLTVEVALNITISWGGGDPDDAWRCGRTYEAKVTLPADIFLSANMISVFGDTVVRSAVADASQEEFFGDPIGEWTGADTFVWIDVWGMGESFASTEKDFPHANAPEIEKYIRDTVLGALGGEG